MEARIYADPSLMVTRRCTVEHPFSTINRMSGGGRFLTRGLRAVKAEAALWILAFNILHAVNAFGVERLTPAACDRKPPDVGCAQPSDDRHRPELPYGTHV